MTIKTERGTEKQNRRKKRSKKMRKNRRKKGSRKRAETALEDNYLLPYNLRTVVVPVFWVAVIHRHDEREKMTTNACS